MKTLIVLSAVALATSLSAQGLAPALAPLAAKFKTDSDAIEVERAEGKGTFTLNGDGTVHASWGMKGKWNLTSTTSLELRWNGYKKSEPWTLDAEAKTLKKPGHSYTRQN